MVFKKMQFLKYAPNFRCYFTSQAGVAFSTSTNSTRNRILKPKSGNFFETDRGGVRHSTIWNISIHSNDYSMVYAHSMEIQNTMDQEFQLKQHARDVENDLFRQLKMGEVSNVQGDELNGFYHRYTYPYPKETPNDLKHLNAVLWTLAINPHFKYRLRVFFFVRLLTKMLNQFYGHHIDELDALCEEAWLSLERNPQNWHRLEDHIYNFLVGSVEPCEQRPEVYQLCRKVESLMYYHGACTIRTIARTIYYILESYEKRLTDPNTCKDDRLLYSKAVPASSFLMHMASIVRIKDGTFHVSDISQFVTRPRDFQGYVNCLLNICHLPVHFNRRKDLAAALMMIRDNFLATEAEFYTKDDYDDFKFQMTQLMLPQFPDFDLSLTSGERYSDIIEDLDQMFFLESELVLRALE